MPWVLYLFGSGQALFLGAGMVLFAIALLPRVKAGVRASLLAIIARLGIFIAIISAVPLSYWLYGLAILVTSVWLWRERRRGRESLLAADSRLPTPDPHYLRLATAVIWIGMVLVELPYHFTPGLPRLDHPPLYIIGDSITAGMGAGEKHTWPDLLPPVVAPVHNQALPGATSASALSRQANQLPSRGGLVVLEIGGNDLLGETSAAQFERDLEQLLSRVVAPERTIVMFELPLPPLCNEYGRIQRKLAARHGVHLIPKRTLMGVLARGGATLDTIHLSEEGHQGMADAVWSIVRPAYE
jgi:acyl-CoA thioesterase-1